MYIVCVSITHNANNKTRGTYNYFNTYRIKDVFNVLVQFFKQTKRLKINFLCHLIRIGIRARII